MQLGHILFTGASGYLGSNLLNYKQLSEHLTIIDRTFKTERFTKQLEAQILETSLGASLTSLSNISKLDSCIYTVYSKEAAEDIKFIEAVAERNPDIYFVYFSSAAVYGEVYCEPLLRHGNPATIENKSLLNLTEALELINYTLYSKLGPITENTACKPISDYGRNKLTIEQLVQKLFKKHLILRIANPYGKETVKRGFYALVKDSLINQSEPVIQLNADYPGQIVRDFISIDDYAKQAYRLISSQAQGVYNIASRKGLRLEELIKQIAIEIRSTKNIQLKYCGAKVEDIKFSVLDSSKLS